MSNKVVIYELAEGHVAPNRAKEGDVGYDLALFSREYEKGPNYYVCDLGMSISLPSGYWAELHARSSLPKHGWRLANGVGIFDNGYRGPVKALLEKRHDKAKELVEGECYVQLVIHPNPFIDMKPGKVSKGTSRGEGGFGSTTKKKVAEEEEEDIPKKKAASKKKTAASDDEEDVPKKKAASKKKTAASDDEEEEATPKKKTSKKKAVASSDDEEEATPKKKASSKKKTAASSDDEEETASKKKASSRGKKSGTDE